MSNYVCINDSVLWVGCVGLFLLENQMSGFKSGVLCCLTSECFFRAVDPGALNGRTV